MSGTRPLSSKLSIIRHPIFELDTMLRSSHEALFNTTSANIILKSAYLLKLRISVAVYFVIYELADRRYHSSKDQHRSIFASDLIAKPCVLL
jgi:hypothetical protein